MKVAEIEMSAWAQLSLQSSCPEDDGSSKVWVGEIFEMSPDTANGLAKFIVVPAADFENPNDADDVDLAQVQAQAASSSSSPDVAP